MRIDDIMNREINPGPIKSKEPKSIEIKVPLCLDHLRSKPIKFERKVFNYLFENRDKLGISRIFQLKNSRADGLLELNSGEMVLLEIKYALGWAKCCQARIQFQWFLIGKVYERLSIEKPRNSLIVFHHFGADWAKHGWDYFYGEENILSKSLVQTDIAQLTDDGHLIPYPGNVA